MENKNEEVSYLIETYKLKIHPEGGHFCEVYKSETIFKTNEKFSNKIRSAYTFIYFLLKSEENSYWHRLKADEVWHFYLGSTLIIHTFDEKTGEKKEIYLGNKLIDSRNEFTVIIPSGIWFGACLLYNKSYAFVGCSVAPGFEYEDFELADKNEFEKKYPQLEGILK